MSRTVNKDKTKEQKDHILNMAIRLFNEKGYDKTTLDEINKISEVSKGTFYHYFKSKEDLLDYFASRMSNDIMPQIQLIALNKNINALTKFNKIIRKIKKYKIFHRHEIKTIFSIMYNDENIKLRHKLISKVKSEYIPLFSKIIKQGKEEGVFKVDDPFMAAEILMNVSVAAADSFAPIIKAGKINLASVKEFLKKAKAYKEVLRRILGIEQGSLDIFDKSTFLKIMGK